ncbi:Aluminum-activated malate transporter 8 [Abeliophyllum distichum]|uniref:Aluminum-activated malate transporter 8 n=1 Tax=Abeliophyllum distichum TaxID=126358 RepID=A0ABD1R0Z7_9LAMI
MTMPSSPNLLITNLKMASKNLKSLLKSDFCENKNLLQIIPVAAIASLMIETAICVKNISEAVNELASLANFKPPDSNGVAKNSSKDEISHVISINGPTLEGAIVQNLTL